MYCTVEDLRTSHPEIRLVEATDDVHPNETGTFKEGIAEDMIELAGGIIDGYLSARYALPLSVVPVLVRKIAVDLTIYSLYERVGMTGDGSPFEARRKNAMKLLESIGSGVISLGLSSAEATTVAATSSRAVVASTDPIFTMSSMASLGGIP